MRTYVRICSAHICCTCLYLHVQIHRPQGRFNGRLASCQRPSGPSGQSQAGAGKEAVVGASVEKVPSMVDFDNGNQPYLTFSKKNCNYRRHAGMLSGLRAVGAGSEEVPRMADHQVLGCSR